jgi:hypothetical protein
MGMRAQFHAPIALPYKKSPRYHWIVGWVDVKSAWTLW